MTERKLAALALATFLWMAALSGALSYGYMSDTERITADVSVAGNVGQGPGDGPGGGGSAGNVPPGNDGPPGAGGAGNAPTDDASTGGEAGNAPTDDETPADPGAGNAPASGAGNAAASEGRAGNAASIVASSAVETRAAVARNGMS